MTLKNVPLGEIIAERHLEAKDEAGEEREIIDRIGKPIPDPSPDANGAWCCPYEIVGFADSCLDSALGEDSMQALVLGLQKIVIKISNQQKAEKLKLTWNGWENLDFTVRSEEDFYEWLMSEQYRNGMIKVRDAQLRSDG
jgi:hypothetical protein